MAVEEKRSLGRLFLEGLVWGSAFVIAGGALKYTWSAMTSKDKDEPLDEGDDDDDGEE